MTSIDAVAALFFFFFLCQFILFLMLAWIVRKYNKAIWIVHKQFREQKNFWKKEARREKIFRVLDRKDNEEQK